MKDKQTIAQFLNVKDFPFEIKDKKGKLIYYEDSEGFWIKCGYNDKGNEIYYENSDGFWIKNKYDDAGNDIYREYSDGFWSKSEYDDAGNRIYCESSDGIVFDHRPKPMIDLTLEDIAKMKGVDVSQIRIKE
jgi:hypothetical protein